MNPLEYGLSGVIIAALTWGSLGHLDATKLEAKLALADSKIVTLETNYDKLDTEYTTLVNTIEKQRIDYEGRITEYENNPITVTNTVYKYIPKVINIERGDCNDTNGVLDFIRSNHP